MLSIIAILGSLLLAGIVGTSREAAGRREFGLVAGLAVLVMLALGGSILDCDRETGCKRRRVGRPTHG